ncbi:MAG: restriction endonuclease subunit S [Spirulinaceae cyanobacterium]
MHILSLENIPAHWCLVKLTDISSLEKNAIKRGPFGSTIKKSMFVESGYKVYEQKNAIYDDCSLGNYYITAEKFEELIDFAVKPGDFIVSCAGTIGKIAIVSGDSTPGIINQALLKISLNSQAVNKQYFLELFRSRFFQDSISGNVQGSAMKNMASVKVLKKADIPLPPLNEQRRIVAKIEELNDRISTAKTALEAAREAVGQFRQSVLAAAFRGDLTADWRAAHPDVEPAAVLLERIRVELKEVKKKKVKNTLDDPHELPESWVWQELNDICFVITDGDHQAPPKTDSGIPFIVISNINTGKIDFSNTRFVPISYYEKLQEHRKPKIGDIIYSVVGTYGVPVLVDTNREFCFQRHIALLRISNNIDRQYFVSALKSKTVFDQATYVATGTTQLTVTLTGLRKIKVPLSPLEEQKEIVKRIEAAFEQADKIEAEINTSLEQLKTLDQAILAKAFRGELVPQDPNDEPASELLKRIAAARVAAQPQQKQTKRRRQQS